MQRVIGDSSSTRVIVDPVAVTCVLGISLLKQFGGDLNVTWQWAERPKSS
jgi:hypothetical protein